jgi:alpha-galactosidase
MNKFSYLIFLFCSIQISGQSFLKQEGNSYILNNGLVSREVVLQGDSLSTTSLALSTVKGNFIRKSPDFSFSINGRNYSGYSKWKFILASILSDSTDGKGLRILLESRDALDSFQLELNYILVPDFPIVRKWIKFKNLGKNDLNLEALDIEDLNTTLSQISSVVYHNYGRMKQLGKFIGDWDDPVVVVHEVSKRMGMALGNEVPAVLKRTVYHTKNENIGIGYTHPRQDFPFRKWIKPGEIWESSRTFICLYAGLDDGFGVIDGEINNFVIKHMRPRMIQLKEKPTFVYNTWYPFRTFISDSLIRDVAKAASDCGIQEFILDDGWQVNNGGISSEKGWGNNYGDWEVDKNKFPGGLKPTFDYIRSLGMKPGLWMSIGSATKDASVFKEHPEWFVKNQRDQLSDLHGGTSESDFYSSCFGTDWYTYILNTLLRFVKENGLAYAKLDFSVATSAYTNDPVLSGCYSLEHPYHRDQPESFQIIYQQVLRLFDDLHNQAPGLFIDCTFETAGKLQLIDYSIVEHADGDWLSNFEEASPLGALRVRQMAWWRSPALPGGALVVGNLPMDDPDFEFGLKSLIGTLPIVLGDPRDLTLEKRAMIKQWSGWMKDMEEKYDYMSYRRDLAGFGEPKEGAWDGWQRINFQNRRGGIFGVFRQGAAEKNRCIVLKDLDPKQNYLIRSAPTGKIVSKASGEKLMEEGFRVYLNKLYDGAIFEIGVE